MGSVKKSCVIEALQSTADILLAPSYKRVDMACGEKSKTGDSRKYRLVSFRNVNGKKV
jgi:hypothetical protein